MTTDAMTFDQSAASRDGPAAAAPAAPSRFSLDRIMRSVRDVATLSEVLRILGASVIIASMSVFLLQGWSEGNDIRRYLMLLSQTGLLGAAGFAMSHIVRETRGARFFFGLALVSIPANFTILGALLYSVFQWDGGLISYPAFAEWRIEDVANVGLTVFGALAVLVPVSLFCFAVMARHSAKPLTLSFIALNALLLLPVRASFAAGALALVGALYALWTIGRLLQRDPALTTPEGKFALLTLLVPAGIIAFRSMFLYDVGSLMVAFLALVFFLSARQASLFPGAGKGLRLFLDIASWPLAMIVALAAADAVGGSIPDGLGAPLFALLYVLLAFDLMRRTGARMLSNAVGVSVSLAIVFSLTLNVVFESNAASAIASLVGGTLLFLWGAAGRRPVAVVSAVVTLVIGALLGLEDLIAFVIATSWIGLAVFGASAIALGSIIDRHGVAIRLKIADWYDAMQPDARLDEPEPLEVAPATHNRAVS